MAHKKGAGSTKNGRDSNSKRLGIKVYGNQPVKAGGIVVRQRGQTQCLSSFSIYILFSNYEVLRNYPGEWKAILGRGK